MKTTPCILLYTKNSSFLDDIIKWQTRGKYFHAAMLTDTGTVLESAPGIGVRERSLEPDDFAADHYSIPGCDWDKAIAAFRSQIGKDYDWEGDLHFVTKQNSDDPDKWFCSEIAFWAVSQGGVALLQNIVASQVSPTILGYSPLIKREEQND